MIANIIYCFFLTAFFLYGITILRTYYKSRKDLKKSIESLKAENKLLADSLKEQTEITKTFESLCSIHKVQVTVVDQKLADTESKLKDTEQINRLQKQRIDRLLSNLEK